ncbi:hypothetical protein [Streptomyces sp. KMM 9044]|uniref:hypothetical protein n=1 Tax=Streptomyces sp. KMM 9044 TaxID=2744474 RepID=UPI002150E730|nr:hypothetical protein [Streptomyces sp. KMM 9044]WAX76352.1 hypothetical protein HUV60_000255 [Streptomyces sp. KMM 9044]
MIFGAGVAGIVAAPVRVRLPGLFSRDDVIRRSPLFNWAFLRLNEAVEYATTEAHGLVETTP